MYCGITNKVIIFNYSLKPHYWSLFFVGGVILGGFIALNFGQVASLALGQKTLSFLTNKGLLLPTGLYPLDLFNFHNTKGIVLIILGGFLIGFGTRWANGCTSGHSIFGIANLKTVSIVAIISFFCRRPFDDSFHF